MWALDSVFDQTADGRPLKILDVTDEYTRDALACYSQPDAPWQNPYVESFNGHLRRELLDLESFNSLLEAQIPIEDWRRKHDHCPPPIPPLPNTSSSRPLMACSRATRAPETGGPKDGVTSDGFNSSDGMQKGNKMASSEMQEVIDSITDFPLDVPGQREHYRKVWSAVPVDDDITGEPADLGGIGGGLSEWVTADGVSDDAVWIYYHGGGYVCGEPWMWRQFNGRLARASGMRCLAFDYRLAPEHPFPIAIEDSVEAYRWLLNNGYRPEQIALVGDSAGGALVLSVMMALRDRSEPLPAAGLPMSPWTDLELRGETMTPEMGDPLTTEASARSMAERFMAGQDPRHPWASAIYADLSGLPPLHIEAGERDVLYSDSTRLVDLLDKAGTDVTFVSIPGAIHSFPALAGSTPEAAEAIGRMAAFMRRHVSTGASIS